MFDLFQAWCKFTECIVQYQLIDIEKHKGDEAEAYQSAHLCEAPGGFITSLNHYIKTQGNKYCKHTITNSGTVGK